ncbi:PREDICTED: eukaryotic translation initiation factor 4B2-like [Camelina sativa]|uniref:Eukaryotic translation initiation factor 4B2-like n=1 Tax=Camelina sativa TaxID=90675 RepID=A0ABM0Y3I5_CAMSA|nr:PREDICTED: eukaryotic translation initiation factor 4B2-like [Camelina sativa]
MSKPWGGIGAWADEAERADEEQAAEATATAADSQSFPSLKEAATAKSSKKKKKMTLSEFANGPCTAPSSAGLTREQMLQLPTGPRQRSDDEMQPGRLGGGFSSYGGGRSSGPPGRMSRDRDDSDGSWGGGGGRRSYGGFDDDQRGSNSRVSDFPQVSRADEDDDWGKGKKSLPSFDQGRQGGRYGGLGGAGAGGGSYGGGGASGGSYGGGGGGGFSKADEVDNWGAGKAKSSTFGSGYRDSGPEPDRCARGVLPSGGVQEERRRLVLEPRKVDSGVSETEAETETAVKTSKPSPFGAARPREQVLAEKGLDWKKIDSEIEAKKGQTSRPSSAQSSRPSSAQSNRSESTALNNVENVVKPRPKVNPFGYAKPREVLLEEQGKDWRKMDSELEHRRVDRPETEEERMLKEEIEELRKKPEKEAAMAPESKESQPEAENNNDNLPDLIREKEKDLDLLIRELDDKVRFRPRAVERPGSSASRNSYSDRPHSRAGSIDESRNVDSMERPRSRGTGDNWPRQVDDRRNFQGSKERGFFSNRNFDRSSSSPRQGW